VPQDQGRKALHAYVSDAAHDHWHRFAADQGVSVSAVLEALAGELDTERAEAADPMRDRLDEVVRSARRIDAQRRRRTRS
jgi:DNA polymerase III delta prime subunit